MITNVSSTNLLQKVGGCGAVLMAFFSKRPPYINLPLWGSMVNPWLPPLFVHGTCPGRWSLCCWDRTPTDRWCFVLSWMFYVEVPCHLLVVALWSWLQVLLEQMWIKLSHHRRQYILVVAAWCFWLAPQSPWYSGHWMLIFLPRVWEFWPVLLRCCMSLTLCWIQLVSVVLQLNGLLVAHKILECQHQ